MADEERARQGFLLRMEQEKQTGEMERELAAVDKLIEKMHADITRCFWHSSSQFVMLEIILPIANWQTQGVGFGSDSTGQCFERNSGKKDPSAGCT